MPRRRKTHAEKFPDLDKLRVDFLNLPLIGSEEDVLVFLTQKNARGKDLTLQFHLDIAIKTFSQLTKKLREYKRVRALPSSFRGTIEIDRFTGRPL
jgi:hypothetical protein